MKLFEIKNTNVYGSVNRHYYGLGITVNYDSDFPFGKWAIGISLTLIITFNLEILKV